MSDCYQIDPYFLALLQAFSSPVQKEAAIRQIGLQYNISPEDLERKFQSLLNTGVLALEGDGVATKQSSRFSLLFSSLINHRTMLQDLPRCRAFEAAIQSVVRKGDYVVDVGSGSGILSFFAAKAGAGKVTGLEQSKVVVEARKLAQLNGLTEIVEFIEGDAASFSPSKPADVLVGEWAGLFLFDEWRHFEAFAQTRNKVLRPGGQVVPKRARLYLAPIDDERLFYQEGPGFWLNPVGGFDFSIGFQREINLKQVWILQANKEKLVGKPWEILNLDCTTMDSSAYVFRTSHRETSQHEGVIHGFIGWFTLELAAGIFLDTSPFSQTTHWRQAYLPIIPFQIKKEDILETNVETVRNPTTFEPELNLNVRLLRSSKIEVSHRYTYKVGNRFGV